MTEKKRKPKATGPRTEVFAMRLDPKLKYLAEIGARKQRRSLANFVEWAIEQGLNRVQLVESGLNGEGPTVADASAQLWALDEPDRLIKLATHYPDLLSYEEQLIWRVICDHSVYNKDQKRFSRFKEANGFNFVQQCWAEIKAYAMNPEKPETKQQLDAALLSHDDFPF
ncbi:MAG: hypothetical protein Q8L95_06120 [Burkholderiales bacterium]|nr:hypothetical protein [Burkholderiales bacterium]